MIAIWSDQLNYYHTKPYLPSETILGEPLISVDGRCACCHSFSDDDIAYMIERGATMYDELPSDFVVRSNDI